jgi:hypothetical protein
MISVREEMLKTMRAVPVVARALVAGLDDEAIRRRPAPGEWAIVEVVAHMADSDERAAERIDRILTEEVPDLPAFDQERLAVERHYIGLDLANELHRLEAGLHELAVRLEHLEDAGWRRSGRHDEHGLMSVELYLSHVVAEDVDHLAQIARLRPGYR